MPWRQKTKDGGCNVTEDNATTVPHSCLRKHDCKTQQQNICTKSLKTDNTMCIVTNL